MQRGNLFVYLYCTVAVCACVYVFVSGASVEVRGPDSSPACVHQRANLIILITPFRILARLWLPCHNVTVWM